MPSKFFPFIRAIKSADIKCNRDHYDKPLFGDCYSLLSALPSAGNVTYATSSSNNYDKTPIMGGRAFRKFP